MKEFLVIGSAPAEEDCVHVTAEGGYQAKMRKECQRFLDGIRLKLGAEPEGARLAVKSFPHDFGSYYEVVCWYDTDKEASAEYAYKCDSECPNTWEEIEALGSASKPNGTVVESDVTAKINALAEIEGFTSTDEMIAAYINDSVVPGICMNPDCDNTVDVEPDQDRGYCEDCKTNSVKAATVLLAVI